MKDYGPEPYVVDIEALTTSNDTYRTAVWTGHNLQLTVMSIDPGQEIGLEVHDDHDQFLRVEAGRARVEMGPAKDRLDFLEHAEDDFAIFVPAGTWHNVVNAGDEPLKLYSIYAPAEHPHGTVHRTRPNEGG
ncbi:MAG TPA: cupin domain-containing protein [Nocardiopsis listeri]|uniref:cupin domain-containing protein n=1 Tax=Nocardiopsis listeri TaxID=53440 RepID=UPI001D4C8D7C|nr:cupin domain-containing protein [Nocardiopsis listeri]HJE57174.1 cupin domain-containing protein [Nocardiopsis listeri]